MTPRSVYAEGGRVSSVLVLIPRASDGEGVGGNWGGLEITEINKADVPVLVVTEAGARKVGASGNPAVLAASVEITPFFIPCEQSWPRLGPGTRNKLTTCRSTCCRSC